jgi:predicted helicase
MSSLLIHRYLNELQDLRKVSGTTRESVVREAFKDLLKGVARSHDLIFVSEYQIETPAKERRYVDGALLHALRVPFGYWEAKDEKDDLDAEIAHKFKRGYPQDNIIFEDSTQAVLIQNNKTVLRCGVEDQASLQKLLDLFFGYERAEIMDFRKGVEQFKADLPAVLESLRAMIEKAISENKTFRAAAARFLAHAREAINPSLTEADVREMLIQHVLTEEIFSKVFGEDDFHRQNNVAKALYDLEATFFTGDVKKKTLKGLGPYYAAIRAAADRISSHHEKQAFLKVIYENFYKVYNPKAADRLGVVYTPNEIVRFMVESADWLCERHFQRNLIDKDVEILDFAAGTGTFICELLEHFRGQPEKLKFKYREELHANEVAILPYYVANLNIEATYAALTGEYAEFPNLCFVDTLDNVAALRAYRGQQDGIFGSVSEENVERIQRQNRRKISVLLGNPPYNANQANENENNKNREYPEIDKRIKQTYIAASTAQKTKLYDMYARFFRWASDRLDENGILAFITNRSFLDSRTFDGFRKVVAQEFHEIWVVDLGGDVRANPKLSGTKNNVFGIQTGVAISFLVKKANSQGCRIYYMRRPELETREEKLAFLGSAKLHSMPHEEVRPDAKSGWTPNPISDYETLLPLANKGTKRSLKKGQEEAIFKLFSLGVVTNRDEWVYDASAEHLTKKVEALIWTYNAEVQRFYEASNAGPTDNRLNEGIKWTRAVKHDLSKGLRYQFEMDRIIAAMYRPFVQRFLYFSTKLNEMQYLIPEIFGTTGKAENRAIVFSDPTAQKPFMAFAVDKCPDLHLVGAAAGSVTLGFRRLGPDGFVDNITDWALDQFRAHYEPTADSEGRSAASARTDQKGGASTSVILTPLRRGTPEESGGKIVPLSFKGAASKVPQDDGNEESSPEPRFDGNNAPPITKESIFHYVYAVLHDPLYREKYALNLKREFPRIPYYPDFWQWAAWGKELMDLHIHYETVPPFPLKRTDLPDPKARKAGLSPKPLLKADKQKGIILLDTETTLSEIPPEAWDYKLGNRSALEWVLDQHKEKKPKDPTIRQKFNTYRFADHKEKVIDLLFRVTAVSVKTVEITQAMKTAPR